MSKRELKSLALTRRAIRGRVALGVGKLVAQRSSSASSASRCCRARFR